MEKNTIVLFLRFFGELEKIERILFHNSRKYNTYYNYKIKKGGKIFMKKKICTMLVVGILAMMSLLTGNTYADTIDTIQIDTNKTIVRPGEQVTVTVSFGQELGTYTMDIAYDNALFEYVSAEGGTPNDLSDKVRVVFHDSSGGSNPRTDMSVTFKAKEGITTSNPTEFMVTAEGMANADASVTYDDILVPIVKNVTVEPEYVDYTFDLQYTNPVMKEKETEMVLSYSSPMGRYYEHARLIAEAATPSGASVTLVGTDEAQLKHDLIQSGWGDAQGYKIGGEDVLQELQLIGTFSEVGSYTLTFKLIDRDNSDTVIAQKAFQITVTEEQNVPSVPETNEPEENTPETNEPQTNTVVNETMQNTTNEEMPSKLPKTGDNIYIPMAILLSLVVAIGVKINHKK